MDSLFNSRGLAAAQTAYVADKYPRADFDFAALRVGDITTFVRRQARELSSVQAKHLGFVPGNTLSFLLTLSSTEEGW